MWIRDDLDDWELDLGTYFGVIAGGIGLLAFVPKLKNYLTERKQRVILYKYMSEINDVYYSYSAFQGKEEGTKEIRGKRKRILKSYHDGEISEEHFRLLDTKISECEQKLKG